MKTTRGVVSCEESAASPAGQEMGLRAAEHVQQAEGSMHGRGGDTRTRKLPAGRAALYRKEGCRRKANSGL